MASSSFLQTTPFDPINGDLQPYYRDAYLHGQLAPPVALQVEQYLKSSPVQTGTALGRYHELAAAAQQLGRTLTAPDWVQQQLLFQPTVSLAAPFRRPVVRLALGLFGVLSVASAVQWARNEPLVPVPVVAAISRVAATTQRLVQRFVAPAAGVGAAAAPASAAEQPAAAGDRTGRPRAAVATPAIAVRPVAVTVGPTDSLARSLPAVLGAALNVVSTAPAGTVTGRISDAQGLPLPGATVLVRGTRQVTSTNADGIYSLAVPAQAMLQFGYGGCADQTLPSPGSGVLNITLQPADRMPTAAHGH